MTSATEELRRLLDERGVEHTKRDGMKATSITHITHWYNNGVDAEFAEQIRGGTRLEATGVTPEQTIAATLGSEINGETSDGYHTFNDLYHHRAVLFSVIVRDHQNIAWKARKHHDGTMYDGMFIVGIETPKGQATYHYDLDPYWDMFDCEERECAPEWDGHTPDEAVARIATLGSWTSSSEAANPQVRCTDSGRNTLVRDGEDSHTLLPCPFCGGEAHAYRNNLWHVGCEHAHNGCVTMSAFVTEAEAIAAWNTRACDQCEGGAVPMTDEAMAEHGWVRERTCRPSGEWKSISQTQEVRHVSCSECGHEFGMERRYTIPFERTLLVELPNFCPNCGAEVMDA